MELSQFIAQLMGPTYIVVGLGLLFSKDHYKDLMSSFMKSSGLVYMGGIMAFLAGLLIVLHHNLWMSSWEVVITIFGWLALLKGVMLLTFPKQFLGMFEGIMNQGWFLMYGAVFALVFGAGFTYAGYFM